MARKFDFHTDAGHGWLKVHSKDLHDIGLSVADFSAYSYRDGAWLYLEEDLDAGTFIKQWEATRGEFEVRHLDDGYDSPIRDLDRLPSLARMSSINI
jgi:hypothetical protein